MGVALAEVSCYTSHIRLVMGVALADYGSGFSLGVMLHFTATYNLFHNRFHNFTNVSVRCKVRPSCKWV